MLCPLHCCLFDKVYEDQLFVWVVGARLQERDVEVVQLFDVLLVGGELF